MCGINGALAYGRGAAAPSEKELLATREAMGARGPDGAGFWRSADGRCALAHRRLAILDPTPRAAQPMESADGRYVVTYNGQIYNYPALREALERRGARFRTTCDTEALLHLYALDGPAMVEALRGMFAFAIWDQAKGGLFLARDPYGIKPLYTCDAGGAFRFASQVKALLAGGAVSRDPDAAGIVGFHLLGAVPEPFTTYQAIRSLPAGCAQWVDASGAQAPRPFVSIATILAEGAASPAPAEELRRRVAEATRASVACHLLSDVEVGAFLSAGVDSGAMLGLMAEAGAVGAQAIT
ncbi:MAG: asparagine synthetase B family protein, partial [Caulobacteraceae bacterium]